MKNIRIAFLLLTAAILLPGVSAEGQRTTRKNLTLASQSSPAEVSAAPEVALKPLAEPPTSEVSVKGYDKPQRSRRETFFVTNSLPSGECIKRVAFTITYLDSSGRMLHKLSRSVDCDIPAHETRQVGVKSWDEQFNFYYVNSTVPTRGGKASSYSITMKVDTVYVAPR